MSHAATESVTDIAYVSLSRRLTGALSGQLEGDIIVYRGIKPDIELDNDYSYNDLLLSFRDALELASALIQAAGALK
ncbi:MAG TPA: hypothetical protein VME67_19480 [Mycobacterium sp.]|nr:hypothetical protein [Mycobacterium sp.]HTX96839.1 hypothetical protein [Mycobacterium sp.]